MTNELMLIDSLGRPCLRMGCQNGQARITFMDPDSRTDRMELGLELFGGPILIMRDPTCAQGDSGSSVVLSCEGMPGSPSLIMKTGYPGGGTTTIAHVGK